MLCHCSQLGCSRSMYWRRWDDDRGREIWRRGLLDGDNGGEPGSRDRSVGWRGAGGRGGVKNPHDG